MLDAPTFTESILRWTWSEAGGALRGKVRAGQTPDGAKLFYRDESEPLANLVRDMNKFSNNVMARHIYLALSAERAGVPGSEAASDTVVRDWLQAKAIDAPGLVIENGSGLGTRDAHHGGHARRDPAQRLVEPVHARARVLAFALRHRRHVQDAPRHGRGREHAHLKGGTLNGVQSLAGYVIDAKGKRWIVVMIVNHANANGAQPALDALVEWVHAGGHDETS